MRTQVLTILSFLLILSLFQGCLPDSFKKFKKDPPQAQGIESPEPEPKVPDDDDDDDDDDEPIEFPQLPTFFRYNFEGTMQAQTRILESGLAVDSADFTPIIDGVFSETLNSNSHQQNGISLLNAQFSIINPSTNVPYEIYQDLSGEDPCSLVDLSGGPRVYRTTLPTGLTLNPLSGVITGTPEEISATATGDPFHYCMQLRFQNEQGSLEYFFTPLRMGVYKNLANASPTNQFRYTMGNRIALSINFLNNSHININDVTTNHNVIFTDGSSTPVLFVLEEPEVIYVERNSITQDNFQTGRTIDITTSITYSSPKAVIESVVEPYATGENVDKSIIPIDNFFSPQNSVRYFIDTELPDFPLLSFDDEDGSIQGTLNDSIGILELNIVAINRLHPDWETAQSYTEVFQGGSFLQSKAELFFVEPPSGLSLSNQLILEVNQASAFEIGQNITVNPNSNQQATVENRPLGQIIDIFEINDENPRLLIQMIRGNSFVEGQNIDNRFPYRNQKATILSVAPNNLIIEVNDSDNIEVGDYLGPPGAGDDDLHEAFAIVNHVRIRDEGTPDEAHLLYLSYVSSDTGYPVQASNSSSIEFRVIKPSGVTREIENIISPNLRLSSNGSLGATIPGATVSTTTPSRSGVGVLQSTESTGIDDFAHIQLRSGLEDFHPPVETSINSQPPIIRTHNNIYYDPIFYLSRDEVTEIHLTLDRGGNFSQITFDPPLPQGLEFDQQEMKIHGTPTDGFVKQAITVHARNSVGSTSTRFFFDVQEHFGLRIGRHSSQGEYFNYILHREGEGNQLTPCRFSRDAIEKNEDNSFEPLTQKCFLEAGEMELYHKGVDLQLDFPRATCTLVEHRPYYFFSNDPSPSDLDQQNIYRHTGDVDQAPCGPDRISPEPFYSYDDNGDDPADDITSDPSVIADPQYFCRGHYGFNGSDYNHGEGGGPNCDESEFQITTLSWTFIEGTGGDPDTCEVQSTTLTHNCGGQQINCVDSPYQPIAEMTDNRFITQQFPYFYVPSSQSSSQEIRYRSPSQQGYLANYAISNYFRDMTCSENNGFAINTDALLDNFHIVPSPIQDQMNPAHFLDQANPVYYFSCLSEGGNVLAEINLYIREWNSSFTSLDNIHMAFPDEVRRNDTAIGPVNLINDILHGSQLQNRTEITDILTHDFLDGTSPGACGSGGSFDFDVNFGGINITFPEPQL